MNITAAGVTHKRRVSLSLKDGSFAYVRSGEICRYTGIFICLKKTTRKAYALKLNDWQAEQVISAINLSLQAGFYTKISFAG